MKRFLRSAALALRKLARPGSLGRAEAKVGTGGEHDGDACPATPDVSLCETLLDINLTSARTATPPCLAKPPNPGSGRPG